jgi:PilZ domain
MLRRLGSGARKEQRCALGCPLEVCWQLGTGEPRVVRATCLDVSPKGARIECPQQLTVRSIIYLKAPSYGLMGSATVRFCRPHGLRYHVGLEFTWAAMLAEQGRKQALGANQL